MDTRRLRGWLGLAEGDAWPPPPRELLGLGPADPVELAQANALERMARLRDRQLTDPELVTEGMNRLAQAVIALESAAKPARMKLAPNPKPAPAEALLEPAPEPEFAPATADEVVTLTPVMPPGVSAVARRAFYRELAALRALLRALDAAKGVLADADEPLTSPAAVAVFAAAQGEWRAARARPGCPGAVDEVAPRVDAVLSGFHGAAVVRSMTPSQRGRVAREWSRARDWATQSQEMLRATLSTRRQFATIVPRVPFPTPQGLVPSLGLLAAALIAVAVRALAG